MKRKRSQRAKAPKSPFPSAEGKAAPDPALIRQIESLHRLTSSLPFEEILQDAPPWVEKAGDILFQALMPPVASDEAASIPARIGAVLGRVDGLDALLSGEQQLPIPPEVKAEWDKAEEQLKKTKFPPQFAKAMAQNERKLEAWWPQRPKRRRILAQVKATVARAPFAESVAFDQAEAMARTLPMDWFSGDWITRDVRLCWLLLIMWRIWERFPSVTALHAYFSRTLKPGQAGDLKSFQKLCRKIGFRLRGRGRPRKQK